MFNNVVDARSFDVKSKIKDTGVLKAFYRPERGSHRCGEPTARLYLQVLAVLERESAIQDQNQFILVSCKYKLSLSMTSLILLILKHILMGYKCLEKLLQICI